MANRLFLLIISGLIGVVCNPMFLAASDSVEVVGLDNAGIVETVPLPEPEPEPVPVRAYHAQANTYIAPANNIKIAGRTLEVVGVDGTDVDAGGHVNKYGEKFLYGHNSAAVFGALASLGQGTTFTVTYGGVVTNYVVNEVVEFKKISRTQLMDESEQKYTMNAIAQNAKGHSLALMTCAGENLGGGDATHRLILFADAI